MKDLSYFAILLGNEATQKELPCKRVDKANSLFNELDSCLRIETNKMANPKIGATNSEKNLINNRDVEFGSFHDNMLLFGSK